MRDTPYKPGEHQSDPVERLFVATAIVSMIAFLSGSPSSPARRSRTALAEPAPFGWELVPATVELPGGLAPAAQPIDGAGIPDDGPVEWAPLAPYWSIIWRSGVALARELSGVSLDGMRVVELGCGLGIPSLAAARGGASALATDSDAEALDLVERNARKNGSARAKPCAVRFG